MNDFWRQKRVIVTGGAGFLGRHLVARLRARGCEHVEVPRSSEYDLCSMNAVSQLCQRSAADMVIHLAAVVGGIGANRENPGTYFYKNLMMGVQLMEQARLHKIDKFVAVGTICSYPKFTPVPFREEDIWNGYPEETNAPYGLAKKMLIVQAQAYREQFGYRAICLLPVNLYGPGDNFAYDNSHVVPALIRKCLEARDRGTDHIEVWGTGEVSREFLFVEDATEGILLAAEKYDDADPVNLGAGFEIKVRELARMIVRLTEFQGSLRYDASQPDGQPRRCLDTSRARQQFGFTNKTTLESGLRRTIDWYESVRAERPDGRWE